MASHPCLERRLCPYWRAFPFIRFAVDASSCCREIIDCIWVARRGVLNPIQVRQQFIDTMGREPTIAEVHDLHQMIKSEYDRASSPWRDCCCCVHLRPWGQPDGLVVRRPCHL